MSGNRVQFREQFFFVPDVCSIDMFKAEDIRLSKLTLNNIIRALFIDLFVIFVRTNFENWKQPVISLIALWGELVCNDRCTACSPCSQVQHFHRP